MTPDAAGFLGVEKYFATVVHISASGQSELRQTLVTLDRALATKPGLDFGRFHRGHLDHEPVQSRFEIGVEAVGIGRVVARLSSVVYHLAVKPHLQHPAAGTAKFGLG